FAAARRAGKRVRSETAIGASRVSVPSVAVDLAQSVLGELKERHVVIVGAGETSELTARALSEQGAGTIFVANRHADRALSLAQRFDGSVVGLDQLPEQLHVADIVLSSTSSPHAIVGRGEPELVMSARRGRPPLLLDVARVEALARAVMGGLVHELTIRLRSLGADRGHASLEVVRELFGLRDAQEQAGDGALAEVHDLPRRRSSPGRTPR